jgi:tRNA U34 5-carboxymethylaminomethyl modifying enzyme MnmG/GidA
MCKYLHKKTGANIVIICHQKEVTDEENPGNNKIIPSLMNSAAYGLCAKASFVWYTKIEQENKVNPQTQQVETVQKYTTYIDGCQAYLTKTRKPQEMKIPLKVANLTYAKFKKNILDKL